MGKGRAPCCDKSQVKRGPWSPEEDLKLITFVQKYGHENWRALPKQAGLLRCGKSCRLRWINYLRPDLKRGNFTKEEEDMIIKLYQAWGNKWSKIASQLPGRTDNEIKNVWNTHFKKRLAFSGANPNANGSIKESFSTSSSLSSNDIVSRSDTNMVTKCDYQQNQVVMTKKSLVMRNDSSISSIVTNCNQVDVNNQGRNELCNVVEKVNKSEGQELPIEIPLLETDSEFWNMLDGLSNSLESENDIVPQFDYVEEIGNSYLEEIETKRWLRYLESELGLDKTTDGDHENLSGEANTESQVRGFSPDCDNSV